jgi:hypothetical protein
MLRAIFLACLLISMALMVLGNEEGESNDRPKVQVSGATNNFVALVSLAFSGITFALMN